MAFKTSHYNISWLQTLVAKKERAKYLFFWGHRKSTDGSTSKSCFSQWWPSAFSVDGQHYATAEHWMMAQKALLFGDHVQFEKILMAKSPAEAKKFGRMVRGFDQAIWEENAFNIVVAGNLHKFSQNKERLEFLLNTKDRVLVEASPVDNIWGVGLAEDDRAIENPLLWKGFNLLGFALMEVRERLLARN